MRRSWITELLSCVLLSFSAIAPAARAQGVTWRMEECLTMRRTGDDAGAAACFARAYDEGGGAAAMGQRALAEQALGRWLDAAEHLELALEDGENEWIARNRTILAGALATILEHIGTLEIDCDVAGARVRVDGREVGTVPLGRPVRVEVGSSIVEAEADDYFPVQREVIVSPGQLARVSLVLVARASTPPIVPPPTTERVRIDETARTWLLGSAIGAFVATAGAIAGLIAALVVREANLARWNDDSLCSPFEPGRGRDVECPNEGSAWRTAQDWSIATGILAILTAGAGTTLSILLALDPTLGTATVRSSF